MRKQITRHIRSNRCCKGDNPANLSPISKTATKRGGGGWYESNGDCGEEEGVSDNVSSGKSISSRGDRNTFIHTGEGTVIPVHPLFFKPVGDRAVQGFYLFEGG